MPLNSCSYICNNFKDYKKNCRSKKKGMGCGNLDMEIFVVITNLTASGKVTEMPLYTQRTHTCVAISIL